MVWEVAFALLAGLLRRACRFAAGSEKPTPALTGIPEEPQSSQRA